MTARLTRPPANQTALLAVCNDHYVVLAYTRDELNAKVEAMRQAIDPEGTVEWVP